MQKTNEKWELLVKEFTENYMEKLFYFCLKKTGSNTEAEDLTQDIALNIIAALNKGTVPTSFSAWVWQIARNRYSVWAAKKHAYHETVISDPVDDYEIADESQNTLNEIIHTQQMSLLRRELAFIKSDYRNIVIAYYLENKSIRDIASATSLSISAVQQRLHRARIILKEGMDMAREFGVLSYKPENIAFINNGLPGANGEPWNYISRSLCKNILLAAYRSPSTAEELAMEIGVALPYMEEELSSLVNATLMKKNGKLYETNFFIVSANAQEKIYTHLREIAPELTKAIIEASTFSIIWGNQHCPKWHDGYQPFEDMKWALLMMETDNTYLHTLEPFAQNTKDNPHIGPWGHTIRPNNGEWDILGMECYKGSKPAFVGLHGCVSSPNEKDLPEIMFRQFKFQYQDIERKSPNTLTYGEGEAMVAVANGKSNQVNEAVLKRLETYGYIKQTDSGYIPTILVMRKEKALEMPKEIKAQLEALQKRARDIATRHYLFCREQIYQEIPNFLKDDTFQIDHACANISAMRGAVLEEAIRQGYLAYDEGDDGRMLGAYLAL